MRIVVSLTSIPGRLPHIAGTLETLRAQTRAPDEIRLHLGPECPAFAFEGVRIVRCHDYGPLTKLLPAIDYRLAPEDLIVTADDDMAYQPEWLAILVAFAEAEPGAALGMSGWNTERLLAGGTYEWVRVPGEADVLEGFAGVAYRRGFFALDILEAPPEFRKVDDVWISSYLARRGIARRVVHGPICKDRLRMPGLHNRPEFVALNREAARAGFAGLPVAR